MNEDQDVTGPRIFHGLNGERVTVAPDEDGIDLRNSFPRMKLSPATARALAAHLIECAKQGDHWMAAAAADALELEPEPGPGPMNETLIMNCKECDSANFRVIYDPKVGGYHTECANCGAVFLGIRQ